MNDYDVVIAVVSLNATNALKQCIARCKIEAEIMNSAGYKCHLQVDDNGSNNDTINWLKTNIPANSLQINNKNLGISITKNSIMNRFKTKYVFYIDNDIVPIPGCVISFFHYMELHKECGLFAFSLTKNGNRCDTENTNLASKNTDMTKIIHKDDNFGYSGYAIHRKDMHKLIKWEEDGPFSGPGYGWEDMDLGCQIIYNTDYRVHVLQDHTFLHYRCSSLNSLTKAVFDKSQNDRRDFYFKKWGNLIDTSGYPSRRFKK
ncbi:MAG: hypothetical protein WC934_14685 [Acidithiobacillus sp.]|jgi:glycosyltransferase involved in cell wall biosynthesis|uniref:glycosyltransferase family 2 protein n=1 Tax=Acidithiobacillus sp. TaxID=1872118 RepID=UPI00355ED1E2